MVFALFVGAYYFLNSEQMVRKVVSGKLFADDMPTCSNLAKKIIQNNDIEKVHKCAEEIRMVDGEEVQYLDVSYGTPIRKELIPDKYKSKYDVSSVFVSDLSHGHRMVYTRDKIGQDPSIDIFVLDILDHDDYADTFKYKHS